jgi:peptidyl-prolyl cis-trans isomerase SurA
VGAPRPGNGAAQRRRNLGGEARHGPLENRGRHVPNLPDLLDLEDTLPRLTKLCVILGLLAALTGSALAAELVDRVVAVVNGKLITMFDLNTRVADLVQRTQGISYKPGDPRAEELRRQVLDSLINDILIEQEAARLKLSVSETELDSQIDEIKKKNGLTQQQLVAELTKEGLTLKQFRDRMRDESMKKRLLGFMVHRKVLVTDDEIRDYYEKNKGNIPTAKSILGPKVSGNIGFIMVPTKKQADDLRAQIASGAISFADAAKRFSIGPGREQGGDLGDVQVKDLAPPLRDALGAVPAGQVSQPVMLDGKAVLLTMRTSGPAAKSAPAPAAPAASAGPSLESSKEQIQEMLYKQKFDKLFQDYMDNLRSKAVVEVKL